RLPHNNTRAPPGAPPRGGAGPSTPCGRRTTRAATACASSPRSASDSVDVAHERDEIADAVRDDDRPQPAGPRVPPGDDEAERNDAEECNRALIKMIEQADRNADRDRGRDARTLLQHRDHVAADEGLLKDGIDDRGKDDEGETEAARLHLRGGDRLNEFRKDDRDRNE